MDRKTTTSSRGIPVDTRSPRSKGKPRLNRTPNEQASNKEIKLVSWAKKIAKGNKLWQWIKGLTGEEYEAYKQQHGINLK